MPDGDFRHPKSGSAGAGQQLGVDERTLAHEPHSVDHAAVKELECAVHVTHPHVKQTVDEATPRPSVQAAQPGVAAGRPVADDDVEAACVHHQPLQVAHVELQVGVREEDVLHLAAPESGAQGGAVPPVAAVRDEPHRPGGLRADGAHHGRRVVATAVVYHHDLKLVREVGSGLQTPLNGQADVVGFVVAGSTTDREASGRSITPAVRLQGRNPRFA